MASVPKSYQATIKHPIPSGPAPASPPGPVGPASPTGTSPAPPTSPHTYTDTIFQVPAGKTWQVIKMLVRVPPPTELVSIWRVEKASSSGVEQMVIVHNETIGDSHAWGAAEFPFEVKAARCPGSSGPAS